MGHSPEVPYMIRHFRKVDAPGVGVARSGGPRIVLSAAVARSAASQLTLGAAGGRCGTWTSPTVEGAVPRRGTCGSVLSGLRGRHGQ